MNALRHNRRSIRELLIGDAVAIGSRQYRVQQVASGGMGVVLLLEAEAPSQLRGFSIHGMRVALKFGILERGQALLEHAIFLAQSEAIAIDLTDIYFNLGRIHHYLRRNTPHELWCYEMAIQSAAPSGCRFPASSLQKTRAHFFARNAAAVLGRQKHELWYGRRLHELQPDVNWDNPKDITRFLMAVSDSENEEAEN